MNQNIKIKRVASSSELFNSPSSIKINLKYKKNSLSKILKDINLFRYKKIDKNSGTNYNERFYNNKPKTASKNYRYFNSGSIIHDNDSILIKEANKKKINKQNKPIWNYSYYFNENNNKNNYKIMRQAQSVKKMRIKSLIDSKNPYIIEDWKKPRMIRILEKNSLIEEEIMLKPWKFFPNIDNY